METRVEFNLSPAIIPDFQKKSVFCLRFEKKLSSIHSQSPLPIAG